MWEAKLTSNNSWVSSKGNTRVNVSKQYYLSFHVSFGCVSPPSPRLKLSKTNPCVYTFFSRNDLICSKFASKCYLWQFWVLSYHFVKYETKHPYWCNNLPCQYRCFRVCNASSQQSFSKQGLSRGISMETQSSEAPLPSRVLYPPEKVEVQVSPLFTTWSKPPKVTYVSYLVCQVIWDK